MNKKLDRSAFERVFSDAHVVDVDMSEWDKRISLWALADHYEDWCDRCPLVVVGFDGVREFSLKLPAPSLALDSPEEHLQWNIDDFEIHEDETVLRLRLFGSQSSPVLAIECESISIQSLPIRMLDEVFPGWNRPFAALARPSIAVLARLNRESTRNKE